MSKDNSQLAYVAFCKEFKEFTPLVLMEMWDGSFRWAIAYRKGRGIILKLLQTQAEDALYTKSYASIAEAISAIYEASRQDRNFVQAYASLVEAMNYLINLNQLPADCISVPDAIPAIRLDGKIYGLFGRDDNRLYTWQWCRILVPSSNLLVYSAWETIGEPFHPKGRSEALDWGKTQGDIFQI